MTKMQRPDRYVPLSVRFHTGGTGVALRERFGRDGLLVWVCFLAACKDGYPEGQMSYASEAEGWMKLGLSHDRPDFTLEEFFAFTGRLHKTARRRHGDVVTTVCRAWDRWSTTQRREEDRLRKARKRAETEADTERTTPGQESDLEVEREREEINTPIPQDEPGAKPAQSANGPTNPRALGTNPRALGTNPRAIQRTEGLRAWINRVKDEYTRPAILEELTKAYRLDPTTAAALLDQELAAQPKPAPQPEPAGHDHDIPF